MRDAVLSCPCVFQSEPQFHQLVEQEDGEEDSLATRTSAVTFSRVIEVRHRKSWSECVWGGVGLVCGEGWSECVW